MSWWKAPIKQQAPPTYTPPPGAPAMAQPAPAMAPAPTMQQALPPQAPATHPFSFKAPRYDQHMSKQAIMQQIMGGGTPAPTTSAQGAMRAMNSVLGGVAMRNYNMGPFPDAPGGRQPGFGQDIMNAFRGTGSPDAISMRRPGMAQGLMNFFGKGRGRMY
jgi:hypothetical protein